MRFAKYVGLRKAVLCSVIVIAGIGIVGCNGGEGNEKTDTVKSETTAEETDTEKDGTTAGEAEAEKNGTKEEKTELSEEKFRSATKAQWETWTDEQGNKIEGFKNEAGRADGEVKIEYKSGDCYEGFCVNGLLRGHGKLVWKDKGYYVGNWADGNMDGFGVCKWNDTNDFYVGEWKDGKREGIGILQKSDEKAEVAIWEDDEKVELLKAASLETEGVRSIYVSSNEKYADRAVIVYKDGSEYIGEIKGQKPDGWGVRYETKDKYSEGQFKDGKYHGIVTRYFEGGIRATSYYTDGKRNGPSVQINEDGGRMEQFYASGEELPVRRCIYISGKDGSVSTGIAKEVGKSEIDTGTETWFEDDQMYIGRKENGTPKGDILDVHEDGRHCLKNAEDNFLVQFQPFYNGNIKSYFCWYPTNPIEGLEEGELLYAYMREDGRIGLGTYEDKEWKPVGL